MSDRKPLSDDEKQELLGKLMLLKAKQEGHKKKHPRNNTGHYVPPPSRVRNEIVQYFSANPEPASTNQLLNFVDAKPPNLRRVCRDMIQEGLMRSERTAEGCIYTFVGDVSDLTFDLDSED